MTGALSPGEPSSGAPFPGALSLRVPARKVRCRQPSGRHAGRKLGVNQSPASSGSRPRGWGTVIYWERLTR